MPNVVSRYVLNEGPTKMVLEVVLEADGTGELSNYVLLDPTVDFNPPLPPYVQMSVAQVWYSAAWFDCVLGFNALNPIKSWVLARDNANYHDFRYFGGLKDRSGTDHDGKLLISTNGFDQPGVVGSIIIEIKKNNAPQPVEYQSGLLS